ncbi:ubiquinol oxidase subunit II [Paracandidimonas soli]|uniref:ubiquinol oxidase subunit II n=1 Tax=Paracandidimonas soli TaxID=1917182 RepID=UPI00105203CE|nr:ubiquinol oxidase subunit II [Paracandidimonas soli]
MLRTLPLLVFAALLSGCKAVVLSPSGDIAIQQRDLIYISVALMLIVIIPVMILTVVFAWRYRASNKDATYSPEWDHSTKIELVVWSIPLLIIIALGAITWVSTHKLDPYRPLDRIAADRPVPADAQPLVVEVVALDWKWLFLYPEYGIATVNELAAPVDRPITFHMTSSSVMNSFYIPALAGQVYTMAGMQTKLHAVINEPGTYKGFSANYSGAGFSGMHFQFHGMDDAGFGQWVERVRQSSDELSRTTYLQLEAPSEREPVRYYGSVANGLYDAILNRCVEPNRMCMRDIMTIDKQGGLGLPGTINLAKLDAATRARLGLESVRERIYVSAICTVNDPAFTSLDTMNASL